MAFRGAPALMFADRSDAGRQLGRALQHLAAEHPLVLALPRGGVPVGFEVARLLEAPLDVLLVRKIAVPGHPELALGAVLDGEHPHLLLNPDLAALADAAYVEAETAAKLREIAQRRTLYRRDRTPPELAGRTVLVVDDGLATGATMKVAVQALREKAVRRLVVGVPVAPPDTAAELRAMADELVCLLTPPGFRAVGQYYADFTQTEDQEVVALLDAARAWRPAADAPPGRPAH